MNLVETYMGGYFNELNEFEQDEYHFLCKVMSLKNVLSVKTYKLMVMMFCDEVFNNDNLNDVIGFLTVQLDSYQHENCIEMSDNIKICINRLNDFVDIKLSDDGLLI